MRRRLAVAVLVAAACTGRMPTAPSAPAPPPQPPSGSRGLTISLAIADTVDVGLVIVTVKGPSLGTVKAAVPDYVLFSRNPSAQEVRLIVIGNLSAGPLVTITGDSLQTAATYTATLDQVVSRQDQVQPTGARYSVTITAKP